MSTSKAICACTKIELNIHNETKVKLMCVRNMHACAHGSVCAHVHMSITIITNKIILGLEVLHTNDATMGFRCSVL